MREKVVLVTDYVWPSTEPEAEVLGRIGARILVAETGSEEELLALVPVADAILTCFARVTASVVRAGSNLKVIGRYGIGVDNIAVEEATRLGIPVTNVPAYCLDEVAEHTLALLLACARNLCHYNSALREGQWELSTNTPLFRVSGRKLGILGFGKIGRRLAQKARGVGLEVLAWDPYVAREDIKRYHAKPTNLDNLLTQSDFLSIHTPLTNETRGLLNRDRIRRMKSTAYIINTARAAVIDQDALLCALQKGWIAGAALDVFEPERIPPDHPLLAQPNLLGTPHVAFYSEESVLELEIVAAQNVAAILDGRRPQFIVNPEVFRLARWAHLH